MYIACDNLSIMERIIFRQIFVVIFLVVISYRSEAQNCTSKLQYAQQLFDSGQIEQIPSILDSCIQNGFLPEEKQKAYRLIIQVYLFDYDRSKADSLMLKFLKNYPAYKIQSSDPAEFSELFNLYKVSPSWGIGISSGNNLPIINVSEHYSTANLNKLDSKYSPDGINFMGGIIVDRYIRPNFWISGEVKYSSLKFQNIEKFNDGRESLTYKEKTSWVDIPVMLNLSFGNKKLLPYLFAGGEFGYILSASSEIRRSITSDIQYPEILKPFSNIKNTRENFNLWGIGGIGAHYAVQNGYFSLRAGFSYSLLAYVKPEFRYSDISQIQYNHYIDDNFRINNLFFNISYSRLFYHIKKKVVDDSRN